ncbi:MAG: response regulator transcription factor, partial [Chloroflexota bacterium]|nr:response regulator transcription factor [Chloroflexota bacterium]
VMEALALNLVYGDPEGIAHCLACVGVLGVGCGQPARAVPLLAAAHALRVEIGVTANLPERATFERALVAARRDLGEVAFAAAWATGRALPREQAVAEARELGQIVAAAPAAVPAAAPASPGGLTPRELEVLRLLVEGRSDKEIGAALFVSHRTVMHHVTSILTKLGVDNRTAATHYAVRHGLV